MISSLDFGSNIFNYSLFSFCLHFAYSFLIKLAKYINLLTHYAKGTPTLWLTVFHFRFQNLFHFLLGILFSISFTVLVRYRSILLYLSLEGGPPLFEQFCYRLTQFFIYIIFFSRYAFLPAYFFRFFSNNISFGLIPCSLTTTYGIMVIFFSFCYWDVSLRKVIFLVFFLEYFIYILLLYQCTQNKFSVFLTAL